MKNNKLSSEEVMFNKAVEHYEAADYTSAFRLFQMLAQQGNASSMIWLANMYYSGYGIEKNIELTLYWNKKALELGDDLALLNLGVIYYGMGNIVQARNYFEQALEKGDNEAALVLAKLCLEVEHDDGKAKTYLHQVINGTYVSQASQEEAAELLAKLDDK